MLPSIKITLLNILVLLLLDSTLAAKSPNCSCYRASGGSSASTFRHYDFLDYRNLQTSSRSNAMEVPQLITDDENKGVEGVTSPYFNSTVFMSNWTIQTWTQNSTSDFPIQMVNSPQNVYISRDTTSSASTHLTLRTNRLDTFQSVAELDTTNSSLFHASFRLRARISGDHGAVAGIFFYADDSNESDIEILTTDPATQFRATNQPSVDKAGNVIPGASSIEAFPAADGSGGNGSWTDWNEWRLDWTDSVSEWLVNGKLVESKTYGLPKEPCHVVVNMWSDGGVWSGNMSVGGSAVMDVEWVEMVYNITGEDLGNCNITCKVDDGAKPGAPEVWNGVARLTVGWPWVLGVGLGVVVSGGWL